MTNAHVSFKTIVVTTSLICLSLFGVAATSYDNKSTEPTIAEQSATLENEAILLLNRAVESSRLGHTDESLQLFKQSYYLAFGSDPLLANNCLHEWTSFVMQESEVMESGESPVECSNLLKDQLAEFRLILRELDPTRWQVDYSLQEKLFAQERIIEERCRQLSIRHMMNADELFKNSKGSTSWHAYLYKQWELNDDESLQMKALHEVNLAAQYYNQMHESDRFELGRLYQVLRNELSTAEFEVQVALDKITLGTTVASIAMNGGA